MTANEVEEWRKKPARGSLSPPATAYSRTGRKNQHYNLSETHRNQYNNVNIRRLSQPPPSTPRSRLRAKRHSTVDAQPPVQVPLPSKPSNCELPPQPTADAPPSQDPAPVAVEPGDEETPQEAKLQAEEPVCPLSDPEFPPIAEIDHWVGRCFCHLCTCELHVCPMAYRRARLSQTALPTSYRTDFRRREGAEPSQKCIVEIPYTPNPQPIDLLTTSQRDFQPFTVTPAPRPKPATAAQTMKFTFRSSYQSDFPNWGPSDTAAEKHPRYPYRGNEVKMDLNTTYSNHFKLPRVSESQDSRLPTPSVFPLTSTAEFYGETTTMKEFRSFDRHHMAKPAGRPSEPPVQPESPGKAHFKTMYQRDFRGLQRSVYNRVRQASSIS